MAVRAPDWISFEAEKTEGLDLLGLRAPVQRIGNQLLNGVNTVTPKVRYLSVLVWIIWRYSNSGLPNTQKSFIAFAEAQEAMIVMANRIKSRSILKLVGVTKADKLLDSGDSGLPLTRLAQQLAYNIYVTTSRQLNLTHDENSAFAGLTKERGVALAKTFDRIIDGTGYSTELTRDARKNRVPRRRLEELADKVFLDRIPREERDILIDAILPRQPQPGEWDRLATYALLLWLTQANGVTVTEEDVFSAAAILPSNLPVCLVPVLNGWLEYMIRDVLAVTHEAVFDTVMRQVDIASAERGAPALAAEVIAALLNETNEHNSVLRQLGLLRVHESIEEMDFGSLQDRIQQACGDNVSVNGGLRRWQGGLVETTEYEMAQKAGPASAALLAVAWCVAAARVAPEMSNAAENHRRLLTLGGRFQIGIADVVLPKLDEFRRDKHTLRDVMAELMTRTVQQHLRVAWTRFSPPNGKDVSVLVADHDAWARNNGFQAGRTDSRLSVAISWLRQLGLIENKGLTTRGLRILGRALTTLDGGRRD